MSTQSNHSQKGVVGRTTILLTIILILALVGPSMATSIVWDTVRCPVCDTSFQIRRVASTNSFGGMDTDLFVRASGFDAILYYPRTCPRCLYSGYDKDFAVSIHFSDSLKAVFRNTLERPPDTDPTLTNEQLPFWASYDLILQTGVILESPLLDRAWNAIHGSWAVRARAESLPTLSSELWRCAVAKESEVGETAANPAGGRASREICVARALVQASGLVSDSNRLCTLLGALRLFRRHGENPEALALLPQIQAELAPDVFGPFADSLRANIERERRFQRIALVAFQAMLVSGESGPDRPEIHLYQCGELCRRLGRTTEAREYYTQAQTMITEDDGLWELVEQQLALVRSP